MNEKPEHVLNREAADTCGCTVTPHVSFGGHVAVTFEALQCQVAELQACRSELELQNRQLRDAQQQRVSQLQQMAVDLTQSEQRERRRLAQMIHDELQQLLVAARMKAEMLRRGMQDQPLRDTVEQLCELLQQSIAESRSLTAELYPPALHQAGLAASFNWLAQLMRQRYGLIVAVDAATGAEPAEEDLQVLLYQTVQELLFNVAKHAQTYRAEVIMARTADGEVRLEVSDRGVGFDYESLESRTRPGDGFGLFSIRERLEVIGGRVQFDSAPGKGTHIVMTVPAQQAPRSRLPSPQGLAASSGEGIPPGESPSPLG